MIKIPEKYEINKKIAIKDFIPIVLKPDVRKKVKEIVKKVMLTYQISGEEIPSVRDEEYDYRVIQFYDFELDDIKNANYISEIYQNLIKAPCIIRMYDSSREIYSFGLKRLSKNNKDEIIVTEKFITEKYNKVLPSSEKKSLEKILSFESILNNENKVNFYFEMYAKVFIFKNQKLYMKSKEILEKNIWYDEKASRETYELFRDMVKLREKIDKITLTSEKIRHNQELKEVMEKLNEKML